MFHRVGDRLEQLYKRREDIYRQLLVFCLNRRNTVLVLATVIDLRYEHPDDAVLGKEFVVPQEGPRASCAGWRRPLDYSVDETDRALQKAETSSKGNPEIGPALLFPGAEGRFKGGQQGRFLHHTLAEEGEKPAGHPGGHPRRQLSQVPGLRASAENISLIGGGRGGTCPYSTPSGGRIWMRAFKVCQADHR